MSGVERYPYRFPVWLGLLGVLGVYLFWIPGFGTPAASRGLGWLLGTGLAWFWFAAAAVLAAATVVSHLRQTDVVLTEHSVSAAAPLRRPVCIEFGAVERLQNREIFSLFGLTHGLFEIHAADKKIMLLRLGFRNREAFDQVVGTVAARVVAHGGPELSDGPPFRGSGTFVA